MTNRHIVHQFEDAHAKKAAQKGTTAPPKEEGPQQLTYTSPHVKGSGDSQPTMVIMVNTPAYEAWKKDHNLAIANVVDSYDVLKYEMGRSGILNKPSKSELDAVFGTTNVEKIIQFMLEHGKLQHKAI